MNDTGAISPRLIFESFRSKTAQSKLSGGVWIVGQGTPKNDEIQLLRSAYMKISHISHRLPPHSDFISGRPPKNIGSILRDLVLTNTTLSFSLYINYLILCFSVIIETLYLVGFRLRP